MAPQGSATRSSRRGARPRRMRTGSLLITASSWGLALAVIVLAVVAGPPYNVPDDFLLIYLGYAIVWGAVAGLLAARSLRGLAVVASVHALGAGVAAVLIVVARLPFADAGAHALLLHIADRPAIPGSILSFGILPVLLTTRPLRMGERVFVAIVAVACTLPLLLAPFRQRADLPPNPLAVPDAAVQEVLRTAILASLAAGVAFAVVSLAIVIARFARASAHERRGDGWVVVAQALLVAFTSPIYFSVMPEWAEFFNRWAPFAPIAALLFMPAVVTLFSMRRRPGDEVAFNRAAADVLLFVVFVAAYSTIATSLALVLPVAPLIAGVIGVAVLVLAIEPLRRWIQARVDALLFGDAADPAQLVRRLGDRVPDSVRADELRVLADELRDALRLARLELRGAEPGGARVSSGSGGGPPIRVPLRGSAGELGWIEAAAPGAQRVDRRIESVLDRVSGVVAITVRLAGINRDILAAGERAREVGAEERRMVARELDEGLGPGLARSADRLERLPALVSSGAAETAGELAVVRAELTERTREVRDLARTLLPGALDAGDIDAALRELAERFSGGPLDVVVEGELGDTVHEGREAAVHHLVAELVLLARRLPGARRAVIRLEVGRATVRILLTVDGHGTARDEAPVVGSIRDRADELGGTLIERVDAVVRTFIVELPR